MVPAYTHIKELLGMTIKELLDLDCRESESNEIIQEYLKKIKPLAKYKGVEDVPIYKIEKVISVLSKNYNMRVRDFVPDVWSNESETIWRATVVDDRNLRMSIIYGLSLYEILAKTAIYMYSIREKISRRDEP